MASNGEDDGTTQNHTNAGNQMPQVNPSNFSPGYLVLPQDQVAMVTRNQQAEKETFDAFWEEKMKEIEAASTDPADYKSQQLPLARIKKIMKSDEDVRMISAEAPVLFAKACELFIGELTKRAWLVAQENSRRTVQRSDVAAAVHRTDVFDFLIDVVPREDAAEGSGVPGMMPGAPGARPMGMFMPGMPLMRPGMPGQQPDASMLQLPPGYTAGPVPGMMFAPFPGVMAPGMYQMPGMPGQVDGGPAEQPKDQ